MFLLRLCFRTFPSLPSYHLLTVFFFHTRLEIYRFEFPDEIVKLKLLRNLRPWLNKPVGGRNRKYKQETCNRYQTFSNYANESSGEREMARFELCGTERNYVGLRNHVQECSASPPQQQHVVTLPNFCRDFHLRQVETEWRLYPSFPFKHLSKLSVNWSAITSFCHSLTRSVTYRVLLTGHRSSRRLFKRDVRAISKKKNLYEFETKR